MHCVSDFRPLDGSSATWWTYTKTGFGDGLRSVESYNLQTFDYSVTPATKTTVATTGTFVVSNTRTSGRLWAMAVLITPTVSLS
jgi:hypothetical protein